MKVLFFEFFPNRAAFSKKVPIYLACKTCKMRHAIRGTRHHPLQKITLFCEFQSSLMCPLSRKEHVSHGFSSDTLRKKGAAGYCIECYIEYKRGAEIDSCCDTTIQQATNFGTDASVNQLFARSSMEVVSQQENLPFSSITWF